MQLSFFGLVIITGSFTVELWIFETVSMGNTNPEETAKSVHGRRGDGQSKVVIGQFLLSSKVLWSDSQNLTGT